MPTKRVIDLNDKRERGVNPALLIGLGALLLVAFAVLLLVGFENILALLRYRVTIFLILGPVLILFLWCTYKAFGPRNRP
jgi:hypothetical protein